MRLACQEHLLPGASLVEQWEFAAGEGFDGIELRGEGDFAFRRRLPELRAAREAGAVFPSVCVIMDHFIGDFDAERRHDARENVKSLLATIAELGGRGAITPAAYGLFSRHLPPFAPPRSSEEDRDVLLEALAELGAHAETEGAELFLEPLNRYEDHMLNRVEQAVDLCEAAGSAALKVMADTFHMNIEEADAAEAVRGAGARLAHVHLSDSNRLEPGAGHIDYVPIFGALKEGGFDGALALECRLSGGAEQVLPDVARRLRARWDTA